jgi:hypothetical protein
MRASKNRTSMATIKVTRFFHFLPLRYRWIRSTWHEIRFLKHFYFWSNSKYWLRYGQFSVRELRACDIYVTLAWLLLSVIFDQVATGLQRKPFRENLSEKAKHEECLFWHFAAAKSGYHPLLFSCIVTTPFKLQQFVHHPGKWRIETEQPWAMEMGGLTRCKRNPLDASKGIFWMT